MKRKMKTLINRAAKASSKLSSACDSIAMFFQDYSDFELHCDVMPEGTIRLQWDDEEGHPKGIGVEDAMELVLQGKRIDNNTKYYL